MQSNQSVILVFLPLLALLLFLKQIYVIFSFVTIINDCDIQIIRITPKLIWELFYFIYFLHSKSKH